MEARKHGALLRSMVADIHGQEHRCCLAIVRESDEHGRPTVVEIMHEEPPSLDLGEGIVECITIYTPCQNLQKKKPSE
jgi:hypothetical protein